MHAILILGNGKGLNLENLAVESQVQYKAYNTLTRVVLGLVTVLWVVLLICAAGVTNNTGYLLAIGGMGMLQNVVVVGWRRNQSALGVHLDFKEVVSEMTAMGDLLSLEAKYPSEGRSLLPILFPGELLPAEVEKWKEPSTTLGGLPGGSSTTSSTDQQQSGS